MGFINFCFDLVCSKGLFLSCHNEASVSLLMFLSFNHVHESVPLTSFVSLWHCPCSIFWCNHSFLMFLLLLLLLILLLLLQLSHRPTKDSGKGLSLLRAPSIPPGKAATDVAHFRELVGKGNFTLLLLLLLLLSLLLLRYLSRLHDGITSFFRMTKPLPAASGLRDLSQDFCSA